MDVFERAHDQMLLPDFGRVGQERLVNARVLCARIGGLGGPAALELAAAGVGELRVAHGEVLTAANMNRMIAMDDSCAGELACGSGVEGLKRVNGDVRIEAWDRDVDSLEFAMELVDGMDAVLSAPPFSEQRMLINRACVEQGVPLVDAAMKGWEAQVCVMLPGRTGCLACVCPNPPLLPRPFPVLGAVSAVAGAIAATEVIKLIVGVPGGQEGQLLRMDLSRWTFRKMAVPRRPDCTVCGRETDLPPC